MHKIFSEFETGSAHFLNEAQTIFILTFIYEKKQQKVCFQGS